MNPPMQTLLHAEPAAVAEALARLELTEQPLLTAAMQGYLARTNCTANHPPLFPSFVAWGETVRALREQLAPAGWVRNDEKNYSRAVHPDGHIAIAVATGNEATGMSSESPATKSAKGPSTVEALEVNRLQAWLPGMEPPQESADEEDRQPVTTWMLLVHHAEDEIRAELSLPFDIGIDGRISIWQERILLRAMPLDPERLAVVPPTQPDIDVVVRRKA
jgi:hypothetical protein